MSSAAVRTYPHDAEGRPTRSVLAVPDRYSTTLEGKQVAIMQPAGVPKRREDLGFPAFTLRWDVAEGDWAQKAQAKAAKQAQYLGPWCSNCGKRGPRCKDRRACIVRHLTHR